MGGGQEGRGGGGGRDAREGEIIGWLPNYTFESSYCPFYLSYSLIMVFLLFSFCLFTLYVCLFVLFGFYSFVSLYKNRSPYFHYFPFCFHHLI